MSIRSQKNTAKRNKLQFKATRALARAAHILAAAAGKDRVELESVYHVNKKIQPTSGKARRREQQQRERSLGATWGDFMTGTRPMAWETIRTVSRDLWERLMHLKRGTREFKAIKAALSLEQQDSDLTLMLLPEDASDAAERLRSALDRAMWFRRRLPVQDQLRFERVVWPALQIFLDEMEGEDGGG